MNATTRRNAPRIQRELKVRYRFASGGIRKGKAINISLSGAQLCLEASQACPELTVEFEGKLAMLARTIWQESLPDGQQLVGVAFEGIHWGQRVALEDYVWEVERGAA